MDDMSLTSSGKSKVLSFDEFTAAQAGGMTIPDADTPEIDAPEPIGDEGDLDNVEAPESTEEFPTPDGATDIDVPPTPNAQPEPTVSEEPAAGANVTEEELINQEETPYE